MQAKAKPIVIALEEHYFDAEVAALFVRCDVPPTILERLNDLGALRIREMDEAGIDVQVLSHGAPALQRLDARTAVPLARSANDRLKQAIDANPERFAGFATLPTADPAAAADELERTVGKLGFKGAREIGLSNSPGSPSGSCPQTGRLIMQSGVQTTGGGTTRSGHSPTTTSLVSRGLIRSGSP